MTRTKFKYGLPVAKDVNDYYVDGVLVTRKEALEPIMIECEGLPLMYCLTTLDCSRPNMGVWTCAGLVYRQSRINGR